MRMIGFNDQGGRPLLWIMPGSLLLRLVSVPLCHFVDYTADEKEYLKIAQTIVHEGRFIYESWPDADSRKTGAVDAFLLAVVYGYTAWLFFTQRIS